MCVCVCVCVCECVCACVCACVCVCMSTCALSPCQQMCHYFVSVMCRYSIGTVTVGSDNDMSDVEDNDRAEPYGSVMDDVREVGNESGLDGAGAEDVDEQREERESTEGPGSVTMV